MVKEYEANKPIYWQIAEEIFKKIIRGEIHPGDKLPSVREMAIQSGVNPNTVQRTYSEMERMGIVETKRGQGTFIVERDEIRHELSKRMEKEIVDEFIRNMSELGFTKEDMIQSLQNYLKEGGEQ